MTTEEESVEQLKERITELEATIEDLQGTVEDLQDDLEHARGEADDINDDLLATQREVSYLRQQVREDSVDALLKYSLDQLRMRAKRLLLADVDPSKAEEYRTLALDMAHAFSEMLDDVDWILL